MNYNKSQVAGIQHKDGPMLVLAGPGSGKTAVITQRTRQLIDEYGIDPGKILVITFTKAAAMEMKGRFLKGAGQNDARVSFGTFHAVFFTILKAAYGMESSNVISEEQKYQFMREIISHHHLEYQDENEFISGILGEIGKVKNERLDLSHFYSTQCAESIFRNIYKEYNDKLKISRLIDFDDMLLYTYDLFTQRPDILAAWQQKYQYILIDEFQDINRVQFDIMRLMALPQNNLFVVGDDDQSIYRFRGSKPEFMLRFKEYYPEAVQVLLDVNYRSDANITKDSLQLIGYNKERFGKQIVSDKAAKQEVIYRSFEQPKDECVYIISEIQEKIKKGMTYQDFAVLFRTNTQPRLLSELFLKYNIPFSMKDHIPNLYEHWIAKDIFTYIRLAKGSRSRADFLQIMNRPNRYIGRDSLQEQEIAFDVWAAYYEKNQPWIADRIHQLWRDLRMLSSMSPYAAINYIRRAMEYDKYLEEYADYRCIKVEDLFETLEELQETAKGYKSYEEWEKHIKEYSDGLKEAAKKLKEVTDGVTISTLHSAKGLEFEEVYILDVNEGIIPYKKAILDADIEEERRLFYVGMTRAKNRLSILWTNAMNDKKVEPSRFIREAKGLAKKD